MFLRRKVRNAYWESLLKAKGWFPLERFHSRELRLEVDRHSTPIALRYYSARSSLISLFSRCVCLKVERCTLTTKGAATNLNLPTRSPKVGSTTLPAPPASYVPWDRHAGGVLPRAWEAVREAAILNVLYRGGWTFGVCQQFCLVLLGVQIFLAIHDGVWKTFQ